MRKRPARVIPRISEQVERYHARVREDAIASGEHMPNSSIPRCPECKGAAVKFRGVWVCPTHFEFADDKPSFDGPPARIPLKAVLPNRAARRRAARA